MKLITPIMPPIASADLFIDPPAESPGRQIEFSCRLVESASASRRIWFRFPREYAEMLTRRADPFVLATLVYAMGRFDRVHVHGTVSEGLLANLADFQIAFPTIRRRPIRGAVEFSANETVADAEAARSPRGITAFSGGVDSCFSLFRQSPLSRGHAQRPVEAALMMHGFDIPLHDAGTFARSAERSRELAVDAGVRLFVGATNLRSLPVTWEDSFATAVAAALAFFQPKYAYGLIPSFQDWRHLNFTCGSNPLTDPLLSSFSFHLFHDGTGYGRIEKLRTLTQWPAAMRLLRVCWQGAELDRNCCQCEKCLRTMLMLRVCGVQHPPAFPIPIDLARLERLTIKSQSGVDEFSYLLKEARRRELDEPWIASADRAWRRSVRHQRWMRLGRTLAQKLPDGLRDYAATFRQRSPASAASSTASNVLVS